MWEGNYLGDRGGEMKIPKGKLVKITGFMLTTPSNRKHIALSNGDAYIKYQDGSIKFHQDLRAKEIYNELYKRFPK